MRPLFGLLALCIAFGANAANSADMPSDVAPTPVVRDAFAEVSEELSACYAYYTVGGQCAESANISEAVKIETVKADKELQEYVLDLLVQTGAKGEVEPRATAAFVRLSIQSMQTQIHHSCANLPILIEERAPKCKALVENLEGRFSDIVAERLGKQH